MPLFAAAVVTTNAGGRRGSPTIYKGATIVVAGSPCR